MDIASLTGTFIAILGFGATIYSWFGLRRSTESSQDLDAAIGDREKAAKQLESLESAMRDFRVPGQPRVEGEEEEEVETGSSGERETADFRADLDATIRAELDAAVRRVSELQGTQTFEKEARYAKYSSRLAFFCGIGVVALVAGVGGREWLNDAEVTTLSTGAGIARLGVFAATFYLAGQLFRRATVLQVRAQELERGAIALKAGKNFAQHLGNDDQRDDFLKRLYLRHLGGNVETLPSEDESSSGFDTVKIVEAVVKARGG